jgi:hypothetical protein
MINGHTAIVLEHSIDIKISWGVFEKNITDFMKKHNLKDRCVYSVNTDGKFRLELKEKPEDEKRYLLRISGWKRGGKRPVLEIQRIYVGEPFVIYSCVYNLLDLFEAWALDHKGSFLFKYVDFDEPIIDAYNVVQGLEKVIPFTDNDLQYQLHKYGYSKETEK